VAVAWFATSLGLPNHQAFPYRFHDRLDHFIQRVDFENSLDLCQQTIEQPEVAAGHSNDHRDRCQCSLILRRSREVTRQCSRKVSQAS
jgi:hypothetical protein